MKRHFWLLTIFLVALQGSGSASAATPSDPLDRADPRSAVTGFLESCHSANYVRAAQYLDLTNVAKNRRAEEGPELAKQLEAILNSDGRFNVLQLSQSPEGNLSDDTNPLLEHVADISQQGQTLSIQLERVPLAPGGLELWLFAPGTVALIPEFTPISKASALEARLPRILVTIRFLDTPIWKWIVLLVVGIVVYSLFRLVGRILLAIGHRFRSRERWHWLQAIIQPWLVLLSAMVFVIAEQIVDPSALSRLYIGRSLLLVVVSAFAWGAINILNLFISRVDSFLDPRLRVVSHSLLYMGRRAAKVAIVVIAAIIVLDNWGYNMTTMIAGLGVGGIAIALAAQSTIANVFGGVSVIGDRPVLVGDFGNFGGVLGTVEDIGMRSTRVRTLNRTMMSIPNSSFAGMNLENYALRDKILFNPTMQVKRGIPKDKIRQCMHALENLLKNDKRIQVGPSPVRLTTLTAASFALEMFAYALTTDIDEYYKIEADLFLEIDELLATSGIELV